MAKKWSTIKHKKNIRIDMETHSPSAFWPTLSAHRLNWETHNNPHIYEYDPTDDGPEIAIIARIKAAFPITWNPFVNDAATNLTRGLVDGLASILAVMKIEESL
jgi:hypothetical protein